MRLVKSAVYEVNWMQFFGACETRTLLPKSLYAKRRMRAKALANC